MLDQFAAQKKLFLSYISRAAYFMLEIFLVLIVLKSTFFLAECESISIAR